MAYTINDEFTNADSAPVDSPRTCEPGPGTLTFVQNDNEFSISDGVLNLPGQSTPAWGDLGFYYSSGVSRANGLCLVADITSSLWYEAVLGFATSDALVSSLSNLAHGLAFTSSAGYVENEDGGNLSRGFPTSSMGRLMIVLGTAHTKYIMYDGTDWRLLWISTDTTSTVYPLFQDYEFQGTLDNFRVFDQDAPYDTDTGLADYYDNSPTVNDTWTAGDGDINLHFTIDTLPSAGAAIRVAFRIQDSNNLVYIYVNDSGNVYLYERISGSNNNRGGNITASAGSEVAVHVDGSVVQLFVDGSVATRYDSLGFTSETGGQYGGIGGTDGGTISDLGSWPVYLTGSDEPLTEETAQTQTISAAVEGLTATPPAATVSPGAVTASGTVGALTTTTGAASVTPGTATITGAVGALIAASLTADAYSTGEVNAAVADLATTGESASITAGRVIQGSAALLRASRPIDQTRADVKRGWEVAASVANLTVGKPQASVGLGAVSVSGAVADLTTTTAAASWSGSVTILPSAKLLRAFGEGAAAAEGDVQFIKQTVLLLGITGESASLDVPTRLRVTWVELGIPLANDRMVNAKIADLTASGQLALWLTEEDILPRMKIAHSGVYSLSLATENMRIVGLKDTGRYLLRIADM